MRILMAQASAREKRVGFDQRFDDRLVGSAFLALVVIDAQAQRTEQRHVREVCTVRLDGVRNLAEAVCGPETVIVRAVARRDVDETRAGIGGHEIGLQDRDLERVARRVQRMGELERRQFVGGNLADQFRGVDAARLERVVRQILGQNDPVADLAPIVVGRGGDLVKSVRDRRRKGDRAVAGDCPGRRRPDDDGRAVEIAAGDNRKLHENRVARMLVIFDLGFGERGPFHDRPHHGLRAAIKLAGGRELHQLGRDHGFGAEIHRRVRTIPIADHAQALELLALHLDPFVGVGAAFLAEIDDRHLVLVLAGGPVFLLDAPFDRQAVAIPARHIGRVETGHLLRADDQVLQDLVERVADMEVAVGIGRAVMENELLPAFALFAQPLVKAHAGPARQMIGFALREFGPHRKIGLRQEQSFGIVAHRRGFCIGHGPAKRQRARLIARGGPGGKVRR